MVQGVVVGADGVADADDASAGFAARGAASALQTSVGSFAGTVFEGARRGQQGKMLHETPGRHNSISSKLTA